MIRLHRTVDDGGVIWTPNQFGNTCRTDKHSRRRGKTATMTQVQALKQASDVAYLNTDEAQRLGWRAFAEARPYIRYGEVRIHSRSEAFGSVNVGRLIRGEPAVYDAPAADPQWSVSGVRCFASDGATAVLIIEYEPGSVVGIGDRLQVSVDGPYASGQARERGDTSRLLCGPNIRSYPSVTGAPTTFLFDAPRFTFAAGEWVGLTCVAVSADGVPANLRRFYVRCSTACLTVTVNGDDAVTDSANVLLQLFPTNVPDDYRASEDPLFAGVPWQPFDPEPAFTLSSGLGRKVVYAQTRLGVVESNVASDNIYVGSSVSTSSGGLQVSGLFSFDYLRTWLNGLTPSPGGGSCRVEVNQFIPATRFLGRIYFRVPTAGLSAAACKIELSRFNFTASMARVAIVYDYAPPTTMADMLAWPTLGVLDGEILGDGFVWFDLTEYLPGFDGLPVYIGGLILADQLDSLIGSSHGYFIAGWFGIFGG